MTLVGTVPPSLGLLLETAPRDKPVAVLLRHAERGRLPAGDAGNSEPITVGGQRSAKALGAMLGVRVKTLRSSPVLRCVQTAEVLRDGVGADLPIIPDRLLGDPGIFVRDGETAWQNWLDLGHEGVMEWLVSGQGSLPGMANPTKAAETLVRHMVSSAGEHPGIHVFVTHDSLLAATVGRLLGPVIGSTNWPLYLEGLFAWGDGGCVRTAFRDRCSLLR